MSSNKYSDAPETFCLIPNPYSALWHLVQPELFLRALKLDNTELLTYTVYFDVGLSTKK